MAIVRAIARAHGGDARLETTPGGATTLIRLPVG
jgi:signal transduction histidine kinase